MVYVLYEGQKRFCIYIKRDNTGIICEKKNIEARNYYTYMFGFTFDFDFFSI